MFDYIVSGPPVIQAPAQPSLLYDKVNHNLYVSTLPTATSPATWVQVSSASSPTLKTNGVSNVVQNLLNLQQGEEITLTDNGSGQITIARTNPFLVSPAWWNNGDGSPYAFTASSGTIGGNADVIYWYMFQLHQAFKFFRLAFRQAGNGGGGCTSGFGIYDSTGTTKLMSWDSISTTGTADRQATLAQSVTLQTGIYIFAFGRSGGASAPTTDSGYGTSGSSDITESWNEGGFTRSGIATGTLTAGAMPSSLAPLSTTVSMPGAIPCVTVSPA